MRKKKKENDAKCGGVKLVRLRTNAKGTTAANSIRLQAGEMP